MTMRLAGSVWFVTFVTVAELWQGPTCGAGVAGHEASWTTGWLGP